MCFHNGTPKIKNLFVKICFALVTLCIVGLTVIAGYILISNHKSQIIGHDLVQDVAISYDKNSKEIDSKNSINNNSDSIGMTVINNDEHRVVNTELNLPEPSGLIDSIIGELTLAVNSVNNVLTSGSILVAILTLFIALVGIFAYHDLKTDVNGIIEKEKTENYKFKASITKRIEGTESDINDFNNANEVFKDEIKNKIIEIESFKSSMIAQARYFNKSIEYLYMVSSNLIEKDGNKELRNLLYRGLNIIALYQNELNDYNGKPEDIILEKIEAIENLKDIGTLDDIKDLEIIAQNEPNEEIKRKVQELIGIINHKYQS